MTLRERLAFITLGFRRALQFGGSDLGGIVGEGLISDNILEWLDRIRNAGIGSGTVDQRSVPVFRAIDLRVKAVPKAWLKVYTRRGGRERWVGPDHPVQRLLDKVHGSWSGHMMWTAVEWNLCLWGQAFRRIIRNDSIDPSQWEIYLMPTRRMQAVVDDLGRVEGFIHHQADGRPEPLAPDEIIWDRYYNARDQKRGLSPLMLASMPARMQLEMLRFNEAFFKRGAITSNLAFFLNRFTTLPQLEEFFARFEERYAGADNAHKPLVGVGEGSVVNLGLTNADMEFIRGLQMTKEMVADVYGVPEELMAGAEHPTFSNRDAAIRHFYQYTVVDEWEQLLNSMQEQFIPVLPPSMRRLILRWDTDHIRQMQETAQERYEREVAQTEAGHLLVNEAREGYGRDPVPWGDDPPPGFR